MKWRESLQTARSPLRPPLVAQFIGQTGSSRRELLAGSFGSIGIKAYYILIQFAIGVALARLLGPQGLGAYAFTLAIAQLLAIIAQFGFPTFLVRTAAVYRSQAAMAQLKGLVIGALQAVLAIALIVATIGGIGILALGALPTEVPRHVLLTGLMLVPLLALLATNGGALRGLGHVVVGQVPEQVLRPTTFLSILIGIYVVGRSFSPEAALLAHSLAAAGSLVVGLMLIYRYMPTDMRHATAEMHRAQWVRQSLPFLLLASVQVLNYQTDIFMLGLLATTAEVGQYRVAVEFSSALGAVLVGISLAIDPTIARLHNEQKWEELHRLVVYAHRAGLALTVIFAAIVIPLRESLIAVVFGPAFLPATIPLAILITGRIVYATVVHSTLALSMTGHIWTATALTILSGAMNVGLNLWLIPLYGTAGAAIATSVGLVAVNILGALVLLRHYGRDFSALGYRPRASR